MTGFRGRLVAVSVLLATLVVAVLVVVSHVLVDRVADNDAAALAKSRSDAVAASVTVSGGRVILLENGSEVLDTVAWVFADGHPIDATVPTSLHAQVTALATTGNTRSTVVGHDLLRATPVRLPGHHAVVIVRVDLQPYATSARHSLTLSLLLGLAAIALVGLVAYLGVGRALRVVHEMSALADEWGDHQPGRRFDLGPPKDEFGELGHTLDRLLDRLDAALEQERRLTDEVAHELRTPLTALRGEAQLAQLTGRPLSADAVLAETDRLNGAVSTILGAARARTGTADDCLLEPAVRTAVDRAATGAGHSLEIATDLRVATDEQLVVALLAPLLDNAFRHARSHVQVIAHRDPDEPQIVVDVVDDGPGFAIADVDRMFAAGVSGGSGNGLGLGLARRLARSAGGSVRAVADGRGHVEVRLPAGIADPVT